MHQIDASAIITASALLGAVIAILSAAVAACRWFLRQQQQDVEIKAIKEEQCLLTYGILACLDGLEQLGCNHSVSETRSKIEKHINKKAHDIGGE